MLLYLIPPRQLNLWCGNEYTCHRVDIVKLHTNYTYITFWSACYWNCDFEHLLKHSWRQNAGFLPRTHDDVIKWKHFPRNWPFVREIHRSPVNFPHKGQWRGALMFSLIYAWINDWVNNREAGDLSRRHGHYDVIVMPNLIHWWAQFWPFHFQSLLGHHGF